MFDFLPSLNIELPWKQPTRAIEPYFQDSLTTYQRFSTISKSPEGRRVQAHRLDMCLFLCVGVGVGVLPRWCSQSVGSDTRNEEKSRLNSCISANF
jgi:hypothetical protein